MSKKTVQFSSALILVALSAFASASGCGGGTIALVCDRICFCEQCSQADREACEDRGLAARQTAADRHCDAQFDAYASCLDEQIRCEGTHATIEKCDEEQAVVNKCTQQSMSPFESSGSTGSTGGGG